MDCWGKEGRCVSICSSTTNHTQVIITSFIEGIIKPGRTWALQQGRRTGKHLSNDLASLCTLQEAPQCSKSITKWTSATNTSQSLHTHANTGKKEFKTYNELKKAKECFQQPKVDFPEITSQGMLQATMKVMSEYYDPFQMNKKLHCWLKRGDPLNRQAQFSHGRRLGDLLQL